MIEFLSAHCECQKKPIHSRLEKGGPFLQHENKGSYSLIDEGQLQELSEEDRKKLYYETPAGCLNCRVLFTTQEKDLDDCTCPKCNNRGTNIILYDEEKYSGLLCPSCYRNTMEFDQSVDVRR
jgi:hypothetical protein